MNKFVESTVEKAALPWFMELVREFLREVERLRSETTGGDPDNKTQ